MHTESSHLLPNFDAGGTGLGVCVVKGLHFFSCDPQEPQPLGQSHWGAPCPYSPRMGLPTLCMVQGQLLNCTEMGLELVSTAPDSTSQETLQALASS